VEDPRYRERAKEEPFNGSASLSFTAKDTTKISNIQEVIAISHKRYNPRPVVGSCEAQETPMTSRNASEHYTIYLAPL
jgi:hypothetical protein